MLFSTSSLLLIPLFLLPFASLPLPFPSSSLFPSPPLFRFLSPLFPPLLLLPFLHPFPRFFLFLFLFRFFSPQLFLLVILFLFLFFLFRTSSFLPHFPPSFSF
ncbi:hypothetical protein EMCRGX_G011348, partial [Ephydatia muelleri]